MIMAASGEWLLAVDSSGMKMRLNYQADACFNISMPGECCLGQRNGVAAKNWLKW
jgi:hypothetical protein